MRRVQARALLGLGLLLAAIGASGAEDSCAISYTEYAWSLPTERLRLDFGDSLGTVRSQLRSRRIPFEEGVPDRNEPGWPIAARGLFLERIPGAPEEQALLEFIDDQLTGIAILLVPAMPDWPPHVAPTDMATQVKDDYARFLCWRFREVSSPSTLPKQIHSEYAAIVADYDGTTRYEIVDSIGGVDDDYSLDLLLFRNTGAPDQGRMVVIRQSRDHGFRAR